MTDPLRKRDFAAELGALGYPGFSYLKQKMRLHPAEVLLDALNESDLDTRVAEGLPWLALTYVDMDWDWLLRNAKLRDRQNRLGFTVSLASELAEVKKRQRACAQASAVFGDLGKSTTRTRGHLLPRFDDPR